MAYNSSNSLPSTDGGQSGDIASSDYIKAVAAALNQAHISNVCQPIGQAWPDGTHVVNNDSVTSCKWRIPTLSSAHTIVRFIVDAEGGGAGGGAVEFSALGSGSVESADFLGRETKEIDLAIDASDEHESIHMDLNAPNGWIKIHSIDSCYIPIAEPLTAGLAAAVTADNTILTAHPLGDQTLAESTPISAFIGYAFMETVNHLRQRRRSLGCWSRADVGVTGYNWFGVDDRPRLVMIQPGSVGAGVKIRLALRTVNTTAAPQSFSIEIREPNGRLLSRERVTVGAGQGEAWIMREAAIGSEDGRIPSKRRPSTPEPYVWINFNPEQLTETALLSLSAWSE
tara:strand:+ start:3509 stop:4531 length:1023 start_codon:yes stop_codon:yes gene_type:complete